ncbi:MAG: M48 family metallopeptidase [Xanthomonadales bacterium]|nr:M48 family metallopeptidase [Xanthomonadales bacterium]
MKMAISGIFGLAMAALLAACVTSPTGRSQFILISEGEMAQLGETAFSKLKQEGNVSHNRSINRYVQCVTRHLAEALPPSEQDRWEVVVFDQSEANAFALPGGKVGIHTGMLDVARNQHQLAAVIGHEIAHVIARHGAERVSQQFAAQTALSLVQAYTRDRPQQQQQTVMALLGAGAQVGVLLPFSRTQESEADRYGLEIMARAGFDPAASVELWRNMKAASRGRTPPEFLSTHPAPDTRIRDLQRQVPSAAQIAADARGQGRQPNCHR